MRNRSLTRSSKFRILTAAITSTCLSETRPRRLRLVADLLVPHGTNRRGGGRSPGSSWPQRADSHTRSATATFKTVAAKRRPIGELGTISAARAAAIRRNIAGGAVLGFSTAWGIVLLVVAAIMAVTAASGYCPIYHLLGIKTTGVPASEMGEHRASRLHRAA